MIFLYRVLHWMDCRGWFLFLTFFPITNWVDVRNKTSRGKPSSATHGIKNITFTRFAPKACRAAIHPRQINICILYMFIKCYGFINNTSCNKWTRPRYKEVNKRDCSTSSLSNNVSLVGSSLNSLCIV